MSKSTNSNTTATVNKSIEELMIELTNSTDMALFATACSAKNRVKDFLQGFKGGKVAEQFFNDEKFIDELLGYGTILDKFYVVFSDVFKTYRDEIKSLMDAQKVPQVSGRTKLFRDMIFDRLKVAPGDSICEQLGEFSKTPAGKNFVDTMSSVDGADEEYLLDIAIILCTRSIMQRISEVASDTNSRTTITPRLERVEGEIVTDINAPEATGAAHSTNTTSNSDEQEDIVDVTELLVIDTATAKESGKVKDRFKDGVKKLLATINQTSTDADIKRVIEIITSAVLKYKILPCDLSNGYPLTYSQQMQYDTLIGCLPEKYKKEVSGINIETVARYFSSTFNTDMEKVAIEEFHVSSLTSVCMYYATIQMLLGDSNAFTSMLVPLLRGLLKHGYDFSKLTGEEFCAVGVSVVEYFKHIDIVAYVDSINKQIEVPVEHKSPLGYFSKAGDRALLKTMIRNFKKACA